MSFGEAVFLIACLLPLLAVFWPSRPSSNTNPPPTYPRPPAPPAPPPVRNTRRTDMDTMNVTLAQMAQAFEAWENGFRAEPDKFLTAEECAAAQVSELSADRAAYFRELLTKVPA